MKLLTLNTHSLVEKDYERKLEIFVEAMEKYQPDILALQEVNQTRIAPQMPGYVLGRYRETGKHALRIKRDNHAFQVVKRLEEKGIYYHWTWIPVHIGYGKYDEGLAILCKEPIRLSRECYLSERRDYHHYKTRKALFVETTSGTSVCCVHLGWWKDEEESFGNQWENLEKELLKTKTTFILGDCNVPDDVRGEGYDFICQRGWKDTYVLAEKKDDGITVSGEIDGWRHRDVKQKGMRIDYIWCRESVPIKESKVILEGETEPCVSDHYALLVETY